MGNEFEIHVSLMQPNGSCTGEGFIECELITTVITTKEQFVKANIKGLITQERVPDLLSLLLIRWLHLRTPES